MGTSPKQQTTTTRTELPPEISRGVNIGVDAAIGDLRGPPLQNAPFNTVTPFSDDTNLALNMARDRAIGGSPVTDAASNLVTDTLRGGFLPGGENQNPFVDQFIQKQIERSRTGLDTQFAGSGRNLQAQFPARAEQVNNLVNEIGLNLFNQERNRQQGALGAAIPLANQDFFDIAQLANVGGTVEGKTGEIIQDRLNRFNLDQTARDQQLDDFFRRLGLSAGASGGAGTTTASQPIHRNRLGSALGGAAAGASLGSIFPGIGTAIGAIGGGLLGGLG